MGTYNFKGVLNTLLVPFIILISLYVIVVVIYSIVCKNKKDPKYLYNINFNLYVIGIMIGTFSLSMCLVYFIYKLKILNTFDYKALGYSGLFLLGLIVMFIMFVKATRKNDKKDIEEYQKNKELKLMVNEIKTTKIEKKKKDKKEEKKEKVKVTEVKEEPKKNPNKTKIKENDETIEIEIL